MPPEVPQHGPRRTAERRGGGLHGADASAGGHRQGAGGHRQGDGPDAHPTAKDTGPHPTDDGTGPHRIDDGADRRRTEDSAALSGRLYELSDAELLRAHAGGDPDAFSELVHRHRDRLWAVALRTLADREEAADALQDALLSAYRSAAGFRGDSAVTTWLHRIVVNACLDRARRRQARPTVPLPEAGPGEPAQPGDPLADRDTALVVHRALAELPADQRAALVLVELQGHSVAESAEILGVAEGTVKSRCARGRARLAVLLGHLRNPDTPPDVQAERTTGEGAS